MIEGATKVDAYVVNNDEVKAYVELDEKQTSAKAKVFLKTKGMKLTEVSFRKCRRRSDSLQKTRHRRLVLFGVT